MATTLNKPVNNINLNTHQNPHKRLPVEKELAQQLIDLKCYIESFACTVSEGKATHHQITTLTNNAIRQISTSKALTEVELNKLMADLSLQIIAAFSTQNTAA